MILNKILVLVILLAVVIIVPVTAKINYTYSDDGKILISNGSYWTNWNPIGTHVAGIPFYINGTTNLTVGTVLGYELISGEYNVPKNYIPKPPLTLGEVFVESGNTPRINTISILINTPEHPSESYYVFEFRVLSSNISTEFESFNATIGLYRGVLLTQKTDNNFTSENSIKPPMSLLTILLIGVALIASFCVFLLILIQKRKKIDSGD